MIPMPGKIIVKQDGSTEKRGSVLVSEKFADKDRPMTGLVLAVGEGKPCEPDLEEIKAHVGNLLRIHSADSVRHVVFARELADAMKNGTQARPVSVKAGDRVVFRVFAGEGIEWTDGSMCRCVVEDDLLAVILE